MPASPPVPVGATTKQGLVGAFTAFATAVTLAYTGRTPEAIAAALVAGAALLGVIAGRYAQAVKQTTAPAAPRPFPVPNVVAPATVTAVGDVYLRARAEPSWSVTRVVPPDEPVDEPIGVAEPDASVEIDPEIEDPA